MLITDPKKLERFASGHRIWQGIPGIARTKGGRTFISFYSGNTTETYGNFAAVITSDTDHDFSEPIAVAFKEGKFRCFDPVLWIDPLERLWFIWNVMPGEEVMAAICEDPDADTPVWSAPFYIGRGIMMNKPLVLSSGEWLFPIAIWKTDIYYFFRKSALTPEDIPGSYVWKTSDNGKTFIRLGGADLRNRSFDEHMVMEMNNGVLRMLVRLKRGIGESFSYDRGKNWSRGQESKLDGPCSRFFIQKLRSGNVLLINHYKFRGRNNLTALLSTDDGKTFPHSLLLDPRNYVSYPDAVEDENGNIYVVYDRERGAAKASLEEAYADAREILTAKITEADIINGSLVSEGSFLQNVVCKLDRLDEEDCKLYDISAPEDLDLALAILEKNGDDPIGALFERYPLNCVLLDEYNVGQMDAIIRRFEESDPKDPNLLAEIIRFLRQKPMRKTEIYPIIEAAKAYIEENLAQELSVASLAKHMKISMYYLCHLFKTTTGIGIVEYRNELRLTQAKKLLIHTDLSIGDIAGRVGFGSAAYFTENFSRSEKIPPSEYRRLHKK